MTTLQIKVALFMGLGAIALLPGAKASERDQKTFFTFSGPVEIPGQVLPAGTYVFKLLDSPSHRHIVQVFSKDEKRVFSTFFAIPDYRQRPSEKSIITFAERPAGMPMAIKGGSIQAGSTVTNSYIRSARLWHWPKRTTLPCPLCRKNWPQTRPNPS